MADQYPGEERRRSSRASVGFIVAYRVNQPLQVNMLVGNSEVQAIMHNLSEEGMAILTDYNIPVSAVVAAKFILVNDQALNEEDRVNTIEVVGEVRYSRFIKERSYRLGVQFTNISDSDRRFISEFIKWAPKK